MYHQINLSLDFEGSALEHVISLHSLFKIFSEKSLCELSIDSSTKNLRIILCAKRKKIPEEQILSLLFTSYVVLSKCFNDSEFQFFPL